MPVILSVGEGRSECLAAVDPLNPREFEDTDSKYGMHAHIHSPLAVNRLKTARLDDTDAPLNDRNQNPVVRFRTAVVLRDPAVQADSNWLGARCGGFCQGAARIQSAGATACPA